MARDLDGEVNALLPLAPAFLHILIALGEGERHGYSIMQDVAERTGGRVRMSPGTLYGSIKRMLEEGLIEELTTGAAGADERRRFYRITKFGKRVAAAEAAPRAPAGHWLGGFAVVARSRYLVGIAALVVLINWITSAGDFVLSSWLVEIAGREAPGGEREYIGRFMGQYCSTLTLVGFLIQLLLVSRIIQFAGLARALLVTPLAFAAGYLLVGIVPAFLLLQSVLIVQRSFDYSLLNTTRNALLLPMGREAKYQAKTAIDTFFYRAGDLLATGSVFLGTRLVEDPRLQIVWLVVVLSLSMMLVAWLVGREYARRERAGRGSAGGGGVRGQGGAVLAQ